MTRQNLLFLAVTTTVLGLTWRLGPWKLPLWAHHLGGGFLWGAMLLFLAAALRPPSWSDGVTIAAASTVVVAVELFRLIPAPALDAFRMTLAGQLLLGHVFSILNIIIDEAGVLIAALLVWQPRRRAVT